MNREARRRGVRCGVCRFTIDDEDALVVTSEISGEHVMYVCRPGLLFEALEEDPQTNRQYCFRRAVTCSAEHYSIRPLAARPAPVTVYPIIPGTPAWYAILEAAGA